MKKFIVNLELDIKAETMDEAIEIFKSKIDKKEYIDDDIVVINDWI
jgi:prefoldin subunit 5